MVKEGEVKRGKGTEKKQLTGLVLGRARRRYTSTDVRGKVGGAGVGDRTVALGTEAGCLLACGQHTLRGSKLDEMKG